MNNSLKPIFSRNDNIRKIAFLNWRMDSNEIVHLLNLAEGFLASAIQLAKDCLIDNSHNRADIVIFPILTNANHGIELYIKGITWQLNMILENNRKIDKHHNLKQLFETLKARVKDLNGPKGLREFEDFTSDFEVYLNELLDKINATTNNDKMEFSRYPFDKNFEDFFYVNVGNVEVDLENFIVRFEKIMEIFEAVSDNFMYNYEIK